MWKDAIVWEDAKGSNPISSLFKQTRWCTTDTFFLEYHEHHQQRHHHPHHDVHVLRQASGPEGAQDGRQSTHRAPHSLTETCRRMSRNFSNVTQVQDVHTCPRRPREQDPGRTVPFLTLRFLRSNFGEEWNLSHRDKGQTQNLQEHSDDKLSQLPGKTTYKTNQKPSAINRMCVLLPYFFLH